MKNVLKISLFLFLSFFALNDSSAAIKYQGRPYIKWNSYNSGTLYCYGSMMFTCCSREGGLMYIYDYNIWVSCSPTLPIQENLEDDRVSSEHYFTTDN